jgi:hypothetical protein
MLYQNPAIQSRVEVHLVEEAKGEPSKLLLSFLCKFTLTTLLLMLTSWLVWWLGDRKAQHCANCAYKHNIT